MPAYTSSWVTTPRCGENGASNYAAFCSAFSHACILDLAAVVSASNHQDVQNSDALHVNTPTFHPTNPLSKPLRLSNLPTACGFEPTNGTLNLAPRTLA